jgi:hypothetical protein
MGNLNLLPTIVVEPGRYEVRLVRDGEQEAKHEFWDNNVDYPAQDGPDWYLTLKRVEGVKMQIWQ